MIYNLMMANNLLEFFFILPLFITFTCPTFCSHGIRHGIRQRNSSVPLRQFVDKSTSHSTALFFVTNNMTASLVGRHAVIAGLDYSEECSVCNSIKCDRQTIKTGSSTCISVRSDNFLLWFRCVKWDELDRLFREQSVRPPNQSQSYGCSNTSQHDVNNAAKRICWCKISDFLLAESNDVSSMDVASLHNRRRKNHTPTNFAVTINGNGTMVAGTTNNANRINDINFTQNVLLILFLTLFHDIKWS